jgi:RsiW-degrading membrane proteinase PrsW (M82 family)
MTRRRYKTKWHRYGTVIAVIFAALGGLLQILFGIESLLGQKIPPYFLIGSLLQLPSELALFYGIVPIACGIVVLAIVIKRQPQKNEELVWMVITALVGILGGTLGGLIILGAIFIYIILYYL